MSRATYLVPPKAEILPRPPAAPLSPAQTAAFLEYVRPDLDAVESRMNGLIGEDVRTIYDVSRHVIRAGGKRLRPAMVALSARAVKPDMDRDRIATVGAALEFVHMATLIHDDVVDNTTTRRGKPTANAIYGNGIAVLSGDYVLARAMRLLAEDADLRLIRLVSEITIQMSEGEVREIAATGRPDLPMDEYLEILHKKTASFVEGCCRCGAVITHADESLEAALADYGYRLGMAFQIADDLLDYTGDPCITGKPRGSDLRDGRATLPFLLGMESATPAERKTLLHAFGNADTDDAGVLDVNTILARYDAFNRTRALAQSHVEQTARALALLPPSIARDCFAALTDYVVQRDH